MSRSKRALAVLLTLIITSAATSHLTQQAAADPDDIVRMSPGTFAHTLGERADVVKSDYQKGAIIQNTTGDISLDINVKNNSTSITIYVPSEFTFLQPDTTSVWTSITNDYANVSLGRLGSGDSIAPSWRRVRITNATISPGNYTVKIFDIEAPDVCGRYFFKVFIDGGSIEMADYPTVFVICSLYPAYVSGRVLNASIASFGLPVNVTVNVPGKVIAEGKTAQGRSVRAQAYFNASENGAYILYGLAAGTYNLTASAAGFTPNTVNGIITVNPGQSLEGVDIYVSPSATISGTLCSKCGPVVVPWGYVYNSSFGQIQIPSPISIELLDSDLNSVAFVPNATEYVATSPYYSFAFNGSIELNGHVPQVHAAYVSGLQPGDYYLKGYVNGYLQRDVVAVHICDYSREISIPFDLWRSSQFNVTVHFMDSKGFPAGTPKNGTLRMKAYGVDGSLWGSNSTSVPAGALNWTMTITGILSSRRDYGLPPGSYLIEASFPGYSQIGLFPTTLGEGCSVTSLSFDLIRGGILYLTLRSVNWQTPPQSVEWGYPNATIRIEAIDSLGQVYSGTAKQWNDTAPEPGSVAFANMTGLPSDTYLVRAYTVGYIQTRDCVVSVAIGGTGDITIDLVPTTRLNVTLTFRNENLLAPIDTYTRYDTEMVPVRVEVYDSYGVLAGANATYIPRNGTYILLNGEETPTYSFTVIVVGFRNYAGNPCLRWVNYYDTTDGQQQRDYGLPPGEYSVRVWVPGYVQSETMTVSTALHVSAVEIDSTFDRLAHVFGYVRGFNMYGDLIPISWATVTAYGPTLEGTYSLDGFYEMWLMNGTYVLATSSAGYETQAAEIRVSSGWETPADFALSP